MPLQQTRPAARHADRFEQPVAVGQSAIVNGQSIGGCPFNQLNVTGEPAEHQRTVGSAEPERVGDDHIDRPRLGPVRHEVRVTALVRLLRVDGRRRHGPEWPVR